MSKFYVVEKEINGTTYKAQFNGISAYYDIVEGSYIDGTSNISTKKLAKHIFEKVIIEPKGLTMDDFDSLEEFNEVAMWGRSVMEGKLKPSDNKKTTGKEG